MTPPFDYMQKRLEELSEAGMLRRPRIMQSPAGPRVTIDGRSVVCFCSNDYLGLANDPAIKAAAMAAIERWGVGAGASRLITGTTSVHAELEADLAAFKGSEDAVVVSTGWMANHALVHALVGSGDLVLGDKLNHASIIDACMTCGADFRTYGHCDVHRLEELLERHRGRFKRCLIITDSLFSMDGDLAPLADLVRLKRQYDAMLAIDEAHATGVIGREGRGAAELMGVESEIDATVGTLSKAIGAVGGFVAGPRVLCDFIRNTAREYIYTTALPPAVCAAAIASLRIIRQQPQRRQLLAQLADELHRLLAGAGLEAGLSSTHIVPIIVGDASDAVTASARLLEQGFLAPAIRPPTVPRESSRLRVSLSAIHEAQDIQRFVVALKQALA